MPDGSASRRFRDVRRFDVADSTNRVAARLAEEGAPDGVVVVAGHQTAGRGRLDRRWHAPPGSSLLMSVLLRHARDVGRPQLASLALALAASDACQAVAGVCPLLKWPNDLVVAGVLDGAKLGGILGEVVHGAVVLGLGLNVNWGDERPPAPGIALDALAGGTVDRDSLLTALLVALEGRLAASSERLLEDYRARSATLGRQVRVEVGGDVLDGEATGLTPEGELIVDVGGRWQVVTAGDVTHVRLR